MSRLNLIITSSLTTLFWMVPLYGAIADNQLRLELGGGLSVAPDYEGSDSYSVSAIPLIRFISFKSDDINIDRNQNLGWKFGPSFRYLRERKESNDSSLQGTGDVDDSIEVGLSMAYEWEHARVFAQARYGVTGHDGIVGEVGVDAIIRPSDQLQFGLGPRLSFANDKYMDAYFSVPTTAVNLPAYDADSGIKSAGLAATVRYDFSDSWAIAGAVEWDRLIGDAGDSPIVKAGNEDQLSARIGLVYKFGLNF